MPLSSDWCKRMMDACIDANDLAGAKAYSELLALWSKREKDNAAKEGCVCGKSATGKCVGHCATGE